MEIPNETTQQQHVYMLMEYYIEGGSPTIHCVSTSYDPVYNKMIEVERGHSKLIPQKESTGVNEEYYQGWKLGREKKEWTISKERFYCISRHDLI